MGNKMKFEINSDTRVAGISTRITTTGAYECKFINVSDHINTEKGSKSIKFEIETKEKLGAMFWICYEAASAAFDSSSSIAEINAIMTCAGIKSMDADKYGVYRELVGKTCGLVFQMTESQYRDKTTGELKTTTNPAFMCAFDAKTRQTAKEIIDDKPAAILEGYLSRLAPVKALKANGKAASNAAPLVTNAPIVNSVTNAPIVNNDNIDFNADIPF